MRHKLVFRTVVESVYSAVRTDALYRADNASSLKGFIQYKDNHALKFRVCAVFKMKVQALSLSQFLASHTNPLHYTLGSLKNVTKNKQL